MNALKPGERLVVVRALGNKDVRTGDQVVVVRVEQTRGAPLPVVGDRSAPPRSSSLQCCFEGECPNTDAGRKCRNMCCNASMGANFFPKLYKRWSELFTSAFGLIAALAWNSAVQELIEETDLKQQQKFYYAAAVTGAAVLVAYVLEIGGQFLAIGWEAAINATEKTLNQNFGLNSTITQATALEMMNTTSIGTEINFRSVGGLNEWQDVVAKTR